MACDMTAWEIYALFQTDSDCLFGFVGWFPSRKQDVGIIASSKS